MSTSQRCWRATGRERQGCYLHDFPRHKQRITPRDTEDVLLGGPAPLGFIHMSPQSFHFPGKLTLPPTRM